MYPGEKRYALAKKVEVVPPAELVKANRQKTLIDVYTRMCESYT